MSAKQFFSFLIEAARRPPQQKNPVNWKQIVLKYKQEVVSVMLPPLTSIPNHQHSGLAPASPGKRQRESTGKEEKVTLTKINKNDLTHPVVESKTPRKRN